MSKNIYANVESIASAIILNGAAISSVINCATTVDNTGAKAPRILSLPEGFPICDITFAAAFSIDVDGNLESPQILTVSDAENTGIITVSSIGVAEGYGQMIQLAPFWFDSVNYFQVLTSVNMTEDTTIQVALQPIYQGVPS